MQRVAAESARRLPLRLLIAEDSQQDAELLVLSLKNAGFDVRTRRVESADGLRAALAEERWDLVTSDFQMPQFDAFGTLAVLKERADDLPCIVVSGTIGEDVAVQCMRAGFADYFLKGNLTRLPVAVERELREAAERAAGRRMQRALDALQELALATGGPASPHEMALVAVSRAAELLGVEIAALYWWEPSEDALVLLAETESALGVKVERLARGEGTSGRAFVTRAPVIVDDYSTPSLQISAPSTGLRGTALAVPVLVGDRALGALYVRSVAVRTFEAYETTAMALLASQIGLALESSRLFESLRESEERLSVTFHANPSPMIVSRLADRLTVDANDAFFAFTGYARDETIGRNLLDEFPSVIVPTLVDDIRTSLRATRIFNREISVRTKSGERRPALALVSPVSIAGDAYAITVLVDLAERDRIEHLEREQEVLRAASVAKSAFLASMSHELRTPLNAVLGFSDLLLEGAESEATERRYLRHIKDAGAHLLELINEVLDLSKVEAGRVELHRETIALRALLEPVIAAMSAAARAKQIEFSLDQEGAAVFVDPTRVRQILYNLLSNGIKFTPAGGSVRSRVAVAGSDLRIEVTDTGIGIPPELHDRVFGMFDRLHEGRLDAPGTGLGLALTKRLVELHRGAIEFESASGAGTTFRVALPDARTVPVDGERILVVEDERHDSELVATLAARSDLATEVVRSLAEARDAISRNRPLGVVVDLRLPDGRGEELIRELQDRSDENRLPIIVVTVESDETGVGVAGADDYLTKPIERARLQRWLDRVAAVRTARGAP